MHSPRVADLIIRSGEPAVAARWRAVWVAGGCTPGDIEQPAHLAGAWMGRPLHRRLGMPESSTYRRPVSPRRSPPCRGSRRHNRHLPVCRQELCRRSVHGRAAGLRGGCRTVAAALPDHRPGVGPGSWPRRQVEAKLVVSRRGESQARFPSRRCLRSGRQHDKSRADSPSAGHQLSARRPIAFLVDPPIPEVGLWHP